MLGSIFGKSVRDRIVSQAVAMLAIGLMLLWGMWIYGDLDMSFYYDMPQGILDLVGISDDVGGAAGIAYGSIYNLMGAMTLAGLAISMGARSIAGEERDGTIGLLLANPRSRGAVLASKVAALVALTVGGGVVLWVAGVVSPMVLGTEVGSVDVVALVVHLSANALLWGMVAVAVGGWTGSRTAASATAAGTMVVSYLAAGLLPLFEGAADLAKVFPWYWFSGTRPEVNGIAWGYLGLQFGVAIALGVVGFVGLQRRDLRSRSTGTTLVDRLRANPRTRAMADRLAGSARVSSIAAKSFSDHQGLLVAVASAIAFMGLYFGPLYALLPDSFTAAFAQFPDSLLAMVGQADMSTAAGWYQGEMFALTVPLAFIAVTGTVGSRSIAGEEEQHTMGLLLATPVPRRRVLLAKFGALAAYALVLGIAAFLGATAGVVVAGLDVGIANLAATSLLSALLALVFGSVALLVGAATGRARPAVVAATGLALVAYFVNSFLPLSPGLEGWVRVSPFHYVLGSDPLVTGMAWDDAAVLAGIVAVLVAVAIPLFERRDLRG